MGALADWLIQLLQDFKTKGAIEQVCLLVALISGAFGVPFAAYRYGRKNFADLSDEKARLAAAVDDLTAGRKRLQSEIRTLETTLATLREQQPEERLRLAIEERDDGNEEKAIAIFAAVLADLAPPIARCCGELAHIEAALTVEPSDRPHLERARQLAQAAALLGPQADGTPGELLAEIAAIDAAWEEELGPSPTADSKWDAALDYVGGGGPDLAIPLARRLNETGLRRLNYDGQYAMAVVLLRRAALLLHRHLGSDHPDTLATRNNLAAALDWQGRSAEAEAILREVLPLQEKVLGLDHPNTLATRSNFARAIHEQGRSAEAEAILREVLPLQEKVLGPDHPNTLRTRNELARAIQVQGRSAEAETMWRELLPLQEKVLGREHPNTLGNRNNLAYSIQVQGRSAEAETMWRELLPLQEKVLGREHPDTLITRSNFAYSIQVQGRSAEAEAILREVLPLQEKVLGPHPNTLMIRSNLARAIQVRGRSAEAEAILRELLPLHEKVLGREHPNTLRTRNELARAADQAAGRAQREVGLD